MVNNSNKKILVALSGGVDSSTAAALLKKQNCEVIGVFFRFWKNSYNRNSKKALADVKGVCYRLNIPLKVIDARSQFKKEVVDYFIGEYAAGRTPNPCVVCNEKMKFKLLFEEAKKVGADFVATGHYARLRREFPNYKSQFPNKNQKPKTKLQTIYLLQAKDKNKDQSYFLYRLKQEQLAKIVFPLGNYKKTEVRKMAKKFELPVFDKEESQNICFLADKEVNPHTQLANLSVGGHKKRLGLGVNDFLKKNIKTKKGKIINTDGKVLGEHRGLFLYTIGQRKGVNIGGNGPYWVIGKDEKRNILRITNQEKDPGLYSKKMLVTNVNWVISAPKLPAKILAKTRYRQPSVCATIKEKKKAGYKIVFNEPQRAVCPGQSAVFYKKEEGVLGGGIIM